MSDSARELIAYTIIGVLLLAVATAYFATRGKRRREALRRRGIKSYTD